MTAQRQIPYAGSVHDEQEIAAVVDVLRGGSQAPSNGKNVRAFEQGVAELFGKSRGIMCNSGSSALYLAVELLGREPGDEVITSAVTFSTDIAPLVRRWNHSGSHRRGARYLQRRRTCRRVDGRASHACNPDPQPHRERP